MAEPKAMTSFLTPQLKPWPTDVMPIICPRQGEEHPSMTPNKQPGTCMDCGAAVWYDPNTVVKGVALAAVIGNEKPIVALCQHCYHGYAPPAGRVARIDDSVHGWDTV